MQIKWLPEAKAELFDAVAYYDGELDGLGQRFWEEVTLHKQWIARHPALPQLRPGGYRRVNLKIFPYYIAYVVRDAIWIVAIAHGHRQPQYWIARQPR